MATGSLRLHAALRGELDKFLAADLKAGARAATNVIKRRIAKLKRDMRSTIASAGLGERLGRTVRDHIYPPRGVSLGVKGTIISSALYKRRGGLVDLLTVFQEGATVTAIGGGYLVLRLSVGARETIASFDKRSVAWLRLRRGNGFIVVRRDPDGKLGHALFLVIRSTTIRKRLDFESVRLAAENGLPEAFVAEWEKQASRLGVAG